VPFFFHGDVQKDFAHRDSRKRFAMMMRMNMFTLLACGVILATSPMTGTAQEAQDHSKMDHSKMGHAAPDDPASKALSEANMRMHADMNLPLTGDPDADFIRGMIPHHQGAVDMAKIVLQFGKDPETKKLAENIIASQEKEITMMREWLKAKGIAER
jgi:uncharacterized protein (DUF305 family)